MKLKQKIAFSLALFYMVSVSGIAMGLHYCGGKLASVTLLTETAGCKMCGKMAKMEQNNTCCKDTKVEVKVKDNHQPVAKITLEKVFEVTLEIKPATIFAPAIQPIPAPAYAWNKAPPDLGQPSLNILNCTFRV